ncbi:MAG: ATP-binding protein, partial [Coriobacteriales bacterium]|nr:ATP-binding protein [Coriobacteriales bacterium]
MALIGRKAEREWLQQYFDSSESEFIVIYGRRRVGKTYLVKEFFGGDFFFYFTGVAKGSLSLHMERFAVALAEWCPVSKKAARQLPPKTWMDAFDLLKEAIKTADQSSRKVIFLDELPWMDTAKSGLMQALDYFWNSFASARKDVLLIACGSASSWVVRKLFNDTGGLHNRVTGKLQLRPFDLKECEDY